jgi:hypothetical protein
MLFAARCLSWFSGKTVKRRRQLLSISVVRTNA